MKRAIIALLTTIIGIFGYAVVDKTTDARLATLESQVSSQQDEIESLHKIGKYSETCTTTTAKSSTISPTTLFTTTTTKASTTKIYVIDPYKYIGVEQKYERI